MSDTMKQQLGKCEYSAIHSETLHYFEDQTCVNWRPIVEETPAVKTEWLVIRRNDGRIEVIPTSLPAHDEGEACWCHAVEVQQGVWIHNEPN